MKLKKYILIFAASAVLILCLLAGFNVVVDPFGVFGDNFLNEYAYDMTQNPRIAKIAYIDKHHDEYDSYIIGSSKTSSYSVDKLNQYTGRKFYNMIMYGGDLYDAQKTAEYIINNYECKELILNIGIEEMFKYDYEDDPTKGNLHAKVSGKPLSLFYLKYAFLHPQYSIDKLEAIWERDYLPTDNEVFIPESGVYDKSVRDAESISDIDEFMTKNPNFNIWSDEGRNGSNVDKAVESVRIVKELCESKGIDFKLIASPLYYTEIENYNYDDLCIYWQKLADVTDIYDFSGYSPISMDPRYFYDNVHFRNSIGDMVLAYIYGDTEAYIPNCFGHITTKQNAYEYAQSIFKRPYSSVDTAVYTKRVPILLYHMIGDEDGKNQMILSPQHFEEHIKILKDNGYEAVTLEQLRDYVTTNAPLPEKPVCITFDDGYESAYDYAYPILEKYGYNATMFVIGVTVGVDEYKKTGKKIYPHFNYDKASEMETNGIIDMQSHTYDLHRVEGLDEEYRDGASKLKNESDKNFAKVFKTDVLKSKSEIESNVDGAEVFALSYPKGVHSLLTDVLARECGFDITLTVDEGVNTLVKGLPQSLYNLKRIGLFPDITGEKLIQILEQ